MKTYLEFIQNLLHWGLEHFGLWYGSYRGTVVDNNDPENRGRLQISVPDVWGQNTVDIWVQPKGIFAGNKIGFHAMPQEGDTIWVGFEYGKPERPYWSYGWWVTDGSIPIAQKDVYVFATPKGHLWVVDEVKETMYFSYAGGKAIEINKSNINLGTVGGAAEPALLGKTTHDLLDAYFGHCEDWADQTAQITVGTPLGPSTVPINAAAIEAIKAQMLATRQQLQTILSQVVTLD